MKRSYIMKQHNSRSYFIIPQNAEHFDAASDEEDGICRLSRIWPDAKVQWLLVFFTAILFIVLGLVFGWHLHAYHYENRPGTILDTPSGNYESYRFDFLSTQYHGPPSASVDDAWTALVEDKIMIVPDEDIPSVNTSSRPALRGSNAKDTGVLAKFEGFHALHCVNLLWRHTWPEYYTAEQKKLRDRDAHIHLDHCADLLRQILQCNMDFSIHTYYRSDDKIYGDFETLHQCRDYESILDYVETHQWSEKFLDKLDGYKEFSNEK